MENRYFANCFNENRVGCLRLSEFLNTMKRLNVLDWETYWSIMENIPDINEYWDDSQDWDWYEKFGYYSHDYRNRTETDKESHRDKKRKRKMRNAEHD